MKKVYCIGEVLIDFVAERQGSDLSKANQFTKKAGGAPANVACAISKLGGNGIFIGSVGNDPFGKFLLKTLKNEGVDVSLTQLSDTFTTLAFVSLSEDGERDFVFSRGADKELKYNPDLRKNLPGNILHLGAATALLGGPLEKTYGRYLFDGLTKDMFICFDPNFRIDLWKDDEETFIKKCMPFVEKSHLCKFSSEEAQLISGKEDLHDACDALHKVGTKIITVTLGKEGTLLSMNGNKKVIPSVKVTPVDTTGAGDAFIGCLLYQISDLGNFEPVFEDFSLLEKMVATANKAGAITTTNYGAIVALPTKDQLDKQMNQASLHKLIPQTEKDAKKLFELRLATNLTLIQKQFFSLYTEEHHEKDFQKLLKLLPKLFEERPDHLKKQDLERINAANWYQSEKLMGMQLYVEHFNKDLKGLQEKIPYFKKLGINFLHLMPITTRPKGESDGGYAVNSYLEVDKKYGSKENLLELTKAFRKNGIYLMLDFVVNHTSDEFSWAKKAKKGDKKYQGYYYTYEDFTIPAEFEKTLPEVFPETSPGNFTYIPEMEKWVMTVFNSYQWDLNYTNPEVFLVMLTNLVKLTDMGVDVVRFDALAFLWKKIGTISQNLPEAHNLISLFRMCLQVVAPGSILLAEAIVAPTDIVKYFGEEEKRGNECEIAYNASLMALLWNSIATKKTQLLYKSLMHVPPKPQDCTWINYIRCHDDIGLGYENHLIQELGWNPEMHRKFLLDYYCQRLDWSPATGLLFMYNPKTGDGRITGSAASLLGLEKAIKTKNEALLEESVKKIVLLHGITLAFGGIPLIYAGDEIGTLNDYSFQNDASKKGDSRWVNRPMQDWETITKLDKEVSPQSRIFHTLQRLIKIRRENSVFADHNNLELYHTGNDHVFSFERPEDQKGLLVICNFDENPQVIDSAWIKKLGYFSKGEPLDLVSGEKVGLNSALLELMPYQMLWLMKSQAYLTFRNIRCDSFKD